MSEDPSPGPQHFLLAEACVSHIQQNMEILFQMEGLTWDREKMQRHVNSRCALIHVQKLLLDEGERLLKQQSL